MNLSTDSLDVGDIDYPVLLEDLYGDFLACKDLLSKFNFAEGALAQCLAYH